MVDNKNQDACGIAIQSDLIDNIFYDTKLDMITMDIEGAEIHAIYGARKSIMKGNPKLAISAYHKIEHLWEIPLLIMEINPIL